MKFHRLAPFVMVGCLAALAGCSSQKVDAVSNTAPAVKVEQVPDPNLITVDKPERFPLVVAAIPSGRATARSFFIVQRTARSWS